MNKKIYRNIDLSNIPKNGKLLHFIESVGMDICFEYKEIKDYVHIEDYDAKTHTLTISFPNITDKKKFFISTDNFKKVKFGKMIDKEIYWDYVYNVGDIINNECGDITIIDRIVKCVGNKKNIKRKFYRIKCNLCGEEREIEASELHNFKIHFCNKCGIHVSYPEKFMISVLDQLNIDYITQYSKKNAEWCGNYKYDFYLPKYDCIIETHGIQHYTKVWTNSKKTLENVQQNDIKKKELALKYIQHYIEIDCRKSNKEWISKSIYDSELFSIINTKYSIEFDKCHTFAMENIIIKACELYSNNYSKNEICLLLHKGKTTIDKYLKEGVKLGIIKDCCDKHDIPINILYDNNKYYFDNISSCIYFLKEKGIRICRNTIKKYVDKSTSYKDVLFYY